MTTQTKKVGLAVSAYDRAASWVVSSNILVGFAVALLVLIWLGTVRDFKRGPNHRFPPVSGWPDGIGGVAQDLEEPGTEELEHEAQPELAQLLQTVTDVVTTQAVQLDSMPTVNCTASSGRPRGNSRLPMTPVKPLDVVPAGHRWQVRYNANSIEVYRRQLDHFQIELGVVGGGYAHVDYARNLRQQRPDTRRGQGGDDEQRLYLLWTSGTLKRFDRQLLRAADIRTTGRIVVQFYPQSVTDELSRLEIAHAHEHGRDRAEQIASTVFGVQAVGSGFRYYVISQQYRSVEL